MLIVVDCGVDVFVVFELLLCVLFCVFLLMLLVAFRVCCFGSRCACFCVEFINGCCCVFCLLLFFVCVFVVCVVFCVFLLMLLFVFSVCCC